ncbi:hypothetical protein AGMMS49950_03690 [Endomicrobiia bacterium]|nr:hypothetical protein AGMMS49950_03690 [Endomicrobiia bacterium]
MRKFKVVALGALVLFSLVFSFTEAQATDLEDLINEKSRLEKQLSDLNAEVETDLLKFGNKIVNHKEEHPTREKIIRINQLERRILEIDHNIKALRDAETYNKDVQIWKENGRKRGDAPRGYDKEQEDEIVSERNKKIDSDNEKLQEKHNFIETPGLPLNSGLYEWFQQHSPGWANDNEYNGRMASASHWAKQHANCVAGPDNAHTALDNAAEALTTAAHIAIAVNNYDLAKTLTHSNIAATNAVETLLNSAPDTYFALATALDKAATAFNNSPQTQPTRTAAQAARTAAQAARNAAADARCR